MKKEKRIKMLIAGSAILSASILIPTSIAACSTQGANPNQPLLDKLGELQQSLTNTNDKLHNIQKELSAAKQTFLNNEKERIEGYANGLTITVPSEADLKGEALNTLILNNIGGKLPSVTYSVVTVTEKAEEQKPTTPSVDTVNKTISFRLNLSIKGDATINVETKDIKVSYVFASETQQQANQKLVDAVKASVETYTKGLTITVAKAADLDDKAILDALLEDNLGGKPTGITYTINRAEKNSVDKQKQTISFTVNISAGDAANGTHATASTGELTVHYVLSTEANTKLITDAKAKLESLKDPQVSLNAGVLTQNQINDLISDAGKAKLLNYVGGTTANSVVTYTVLKPQNHADTSTITFDVQLSADGVTSQTVTGLTVHYVLSTAANTKLIAEAKAKLEGLKDPQVSLNAGVLTQNQINDLISDAGKAKLLNYVGGTTANSVVTYTVLKPQNHADTSTITFDVQLSADGVTSQTVTGLTVHYVLADAILQSEYDRLYGKGINIEITQDKLNELIATGGESKLLNYINHKNPYIQYEVIGTPVHNDQDKTITFNVKLTINGQPSPSLNVDSIAIHYTITSNPGSPF